MTDRAARLFNCCTDFAEPRWTSFTALRIGGCIDHNGETEGGVDYQRAEFFTVYGVVMDGDIAMVEAITDVPTVSLIKALTVAHELSDLSGLRLTVCPSLIR
ncbi:hypothetical protein [Brevundimonas nasdae]|uniref:Uncharacterized protein n=1 Tax=Brevundimonas nasdae TaxID=172043 RepID=A0ACD4VMJ3_9CAUL|nr:hypothetical protein [Brevundimonas nasdae]WOB78474.1 hypothetical protein PZA08_14400 [Brevundimonas nasdae]